VNAALEKSRQYCGNGRQLNRWSSRTKVAQQEILRRGRLAGFIFRTARSRRYFGRAVNTAFRMPASASLAGVSDFDAAPAAVMVRKI
jgi:hypothetical protein